jgi:hypothetical protein
MKTPGIQTWTRPKRVPCETNYWYPIQKFTVQKHQLNHGHCLSCSVPEFVEEVGNYSSSANTLLEQS